MAKFALIALVILSFGCKAEPTPDSTPSEESPTKETATNEPNAPDHIEVVEVSWVGEVQEPSADCMGPREPALDAKAPFEKIERSKAGIQMREKATFAGLLAESVTLDVGGCTHETATFEFVIIDARKGASDSEVIDQGLELLKKIPLTKRGIIYRNEIVEAFEKGQREPPNVIHHNATIIYDVEWKADGKAVASFHYDFAL